MNTPHPIRTILVPTDFSKAAVKAYPIAQKFASIFHAKVHFVHVIPTLKYFTESIKTLGIPFDMDKDFYPKVQKESEHRLREAFVDYIKPENQGGVHVAIEGRASEGIARIAKQVKADLIVIAGRGEDGTPLLRGSTSEKVIRMSRVPVFTVDESFSLDSLKQILVPTDGSAYSFHALTMAAHLASAFHASITLYYVYELFGAIADGVPRHPGKSEEEDARLSILKALEEWFAATPECGLSLRMRETGECILEMEAGSGEDGGAIDHVGSAPGEAGGTEPRTVTQIPFTFEIGRGVSAHYEIERKAKDDADMVVMATHGHSGLAHLILGSTTEKVAHHLDKPVLTLRPTD